VEIMVRIAEIKPGDMVKHAGRWYVVKYVIVITNEVSVIVPGGFMGLDVAALDGVERRPVR
jgi:hypothetical protein